MENLKKASVNELTVLSGITEKLARQILNRIRTDGS
ncbi:MAG: hypothetical protein AB1Z38_09080 [Desulfotignum sp.]